MKIQKDKVYHFIAGLIIFAISMYFGKVIALALAGLSGMVKEIYDYFNQDKHTVDFYDFIFTLLGGIFGYVITVVI